MEPVQLLKTVLEELRQISTRLNDLSSANTKTQERSYLSPQVNELYTALAKAQGEMKLAHRDSENPYFKSKYANLGSVIEASRDYLAKQGLAIYHRQEINNDGQSILVCTLAHNSGQYVESRYRVVPAKNDIQSLGSYMTYLRRYSYVAICGLADTDDDGEAAVAEARDVYAKGVALNTKYSAKEQSFETLTKEQIDEMEYELAEYPDLAEQILDGLRIQSIADIPKSKYRAAITRIREIKELRNNSPKKT
jgi:primosomal protein N''